VHIRSEHGTGFDFEVDLYVCGRGRRRRVERVMHLAIIEGGRETLMRATHDTVCLEELAVIESCLSVLMDEGNPDAEGIMQTWARREFDRQVRIAAGQEIACAACGCSETRACSGGCVWVTNTLCSRCV
jgi:hypothetical protein